MGYLYGGTSKVRSIRGWIALNEAGLVQNGVIAYRKKHPPPPMVPGVAVNEPFRTNQCAIIRDTTGVVKVVPLDYLRAYSEAGLVTFSN